MLNIEQNETSVVVRKLARYARRARLFYFFMLIEALFLIAVVVTFAVLDNDDFLETPMKCLLIAYTFCILVLNIYMIYLIVYFHWMAEYFMSILRMDSEKFSICKARAGFCTLYTLLVLYILGDVFNIYLYLLRAYPEFQIQNFDHVIRPVKLTLESLRLILPIFLGMALMLLLSFFADDAQIPDEDDKEGDEESSNGLYRATGFKSYSNHQHSDGQSEIPNSIQQVSENAKKKKRKT